MKNHDEIELKLPPMSKYMETYVRLAKDRVIFLSEDFTKEMSTAMSAMLLYYDNQNSEEDITIYINSHGGDVSALTNIYDVIQMIKSPVKTVCIGKAYSAGALLLCAGAKGKRYAFKHAKIMIHGIQCAFPIFGYDVSNSKNYYSFLEESNKNIMKILSTHTGHTLEKVKSDCELDVWLDAKQAQEYGIIDHILG
jgi:ATP-dependent Clp protease protease subunit